jgi:hypothetical protein
MCPHHPWRPPTPDARGGCFCTVSFDISTIRTDCCASERNIPAATRARWIVLTQAPPREMTSASLGFTRSGGSSRPLEQHASNATIFRGFCKIRFYQRTPGCQPDPCGNRCGKPLFCKGSLTHSCGLPGRIEGEMGVDRGDRLPLHKTDENCTEPRRKTLQFLPGNGDIPSSASNDQHSATCVHVALQFVSSHLERRDAIRTTLGRAAEACAGL